MAGKRPDSDRLVADRGEPATVATDGGRPADGPPNLRIPDTADGEEAAAIAAAIETYLARERAAAAGDGAPSWRGRRWSFAGRLASLTGRAARVPDRAPADGWSAAGRADRF